MRTFYLVIFFIALIGELNAQPGTLDKDFGDNGKILAGSFSAGCDAIAIQEDGKIITAGYGFVIARFNSDGSTDESFGKKGRLTINNDAGTATPLSVYALSIQTDGKIIAAGRFISKESGDPHGDVGIVRCNENGTPDSTFGVNGIVTKSFAYEDGAFDMVIQPDGKILITGDLNDDQKNTLAAYIARFLPNGSMDESFGDKGLVSTTTGPYISINAIALQADNKIVIAGIEFFSLGYRAIRYTTDGVLDTAFGTDGIAKLSFSENDQPYGSLYDITIQPDGKIVAAGAVGNTFYLLAVARFKSNGEVDKSFGNEKGYTFLPMNTGYSIGQTVQMGNENKIIVTGSYVDGVNVWFGAFQFDDNGLLDSSFGENGMGLGGFDISENAGATTGIIQNDGKILVGGSSNPDHGDGHVALVRFNGGKQSNPPEFAKIQKWKGHYGFSWDDWPGNKTTYYSVGRSTNASTFTEIAQVEDVKGIKDYKYQDPAPPEGIVYYQLTAYRTDDKVVSSNIVTCGDDVLNNFIKLYPNPAKNSLRIEGLSAKEKTKLTVIDLSGNIKASATATADSHTLNIATLKPGNYMLRIETNGNMATRMFVKE